VDSLCAKKLAILREKKLNRAKKSKKWANLGHRVAGSLFWYLSIVVASGGKFVLIPIFLVFIVNLSGRNSFWFLF